MERPTKITFGELREQGVRGILVYCAGYRRSHSIAISGDQWPDDLRLSDIESCFVYGSCGKRGADVRPDFNATSVAAIPANWPTRPSGARCQPDVLS
jgi:hypothetical protein